MYSNKEDRITFRMGNEEFIKFHQYCQKLDKRPSEILREFVKECGNRKVEVKSLFKS